MISVPSALFLLSIRAASCSGSGLYLTGCIFSAYIDVSQSQMWPLGTVVLQNKLPGLVYLFS